MTRYHLDEYSVPRGGQLEGEWVRWFAEHDLIPDDVPYPSDLHIDEATGRFTLEVLVRGQDGNLLWDVQRNRALRRVVQGPVFTPPPLGSLRVQEYVVVHGVWPEVQVEGPFSEGGAERRRRELRDSAWQVRVLPLASTPRLAPRRTV